MRLRPALLALFVAALLWSAFRPLEYFTWFLEVFPALIGVVLMMAAHRRFPLTPLLTVLLFIHALILILGGHYTYAKVPLGFWMEDAFGFARNHYDRIGHFAQGFVPAILAREKAAELAGRLDTGQDRLDATLLERARGLLFNPGISVVGDALAAAAAAPVHGMHDPTEGGLIGGLYELAAAAGAGLSVESARVPILPETRALCAALGLDPLRLIASGALLIAAAPGDVERVTQALGARGTPVAVIGCMTEAQEGRRLDGAPFEFPERDEVTRALK